MGGTQDDKPADPNSFGEIELTPAQRERLDRLLGTSGQRNDPPASEAVGNPGAPSKAEMFGDIEVTPEQLARLDRLLGASGRGDAPPTSVTSSDPSNPTTSVSFGDIEMTPAQQERLDRLLAAPARDDLKRNYHSSRTSVCSGRNCWTDTNGDCYVNIKGRAQQIECGRTRLRGLHR